MQSLFIEETNYTPKVKFEINGNLSLTGKSLPEDTAMFYEPILAWITECHISNVILTIRLDYMNSSSAHQISKLLMYIKDNPIIQSCDVNWYYETEDEDSLDFGKELEYLTDFSFKFYQYSEVEA
jgi:hypothetical protein